MKTLQDAWDWYRSARRNLERVERLAVKHWDGLPWETSSIGRDDDFRTLEATDLRQEAVTSLRPLGDLAVVVLFSVFEAAVRGHLEERMRPNAERITDPILREAAEDALRGVREGSFSVRVLRPLQEQGLVSAGLVEMVNQVRGYRNWVAHGRRGEAKNHVTPTAAYDRLKGFMEALGIAIESEAPDTQDSD